MAWIATSRNGRPVRAKDLAAAADIPTPYLSKILRRLVLGGLLVSRKGPGGGFVLSRAPDQIRFIEILRAVDAAPTADQCAFGWGACDSSRPCPLHRAWSGISASVHAWAATTTLGDVDQVDALTPGTQDR